MHRRRMENIYFSCYWQNVQDLDLDAQFNVGYLFGARIGYRLGLRSGLRNNIILPTLQWLGVGRDIQSWPWFSWDYTFSSIAKMVAITGKRKRDRIPSARVGGLTWGRKMQTRVYSCSTISWSIQMKSGPLERQKWRLQDRENNVDFTWDQEWADLTSDHPHRLLSLSPAPRKVFLGKEYMCTLQRVQVTQLDASRLYSTQES